MRFEATIVKRWVWSLLAVVALLATASCSGGGNGGDEDEDNNGPLTLNLSAGVPTTGSSPLRVTFTANISGGTGPYFYAWDFDARDTNGNSTFEPSELVFDRFLNNQFDRTVSVTNDYFLNAADAGGATSYTAVLRITDSENTVLFSAPINVLVNSAAGFVIQPEGSFFFTDEVDNDGVYVARNGVPVFFRLAVQGGAQPLQYQWDFNNDGTIDSTVQSPQYTYTVPDPGVEIFNAHVTVVDADGERLGFDFIVPVNGPSDGTPAPPEFTALLSTDPGAQNGVVTLRYDPTGENPNLPTEPELDLTVVVSPDPTMRGVPPYEYYWDFENDGSFDSQAPSPSIPYFKPGAVVSSNPYLIQEDTKSFTLAVTVIDSAGQIQKLTQPINVVKATGRPVDPVVVDVDYKIQGSNVPFGEVGSSGDTQLVDFTFTLPTKTNSNQVYAVQLDIDGDNVADPVSWNGGAETAGFVEIGGTPGTVASTTVRFGPDDADVTVWPIPNYYAAQATFRRLSASGGTQEDEVTVQVPISFIQVRSLSPEGQALEARSEHTMIPLFQVVNGGDNGQTLAQREAVIIGGANNGTALATVQRLTQTYTPPTQGLGSYEVLQGTNVRSGVSMTSARRGHGAFVVSNNQTDFYADGAYFCLGGRNGSGLLSSTELQPANDNGGTIGWQLGPELTVPQTYPLQDSFSSPFINIICGGLHKSSPAATANVSALTIVYGSQNVPTDPLEPSPPGPDGTGNLGANMITPRYDGSLAVVGVDKIYAIGGREAGGQSVGTVEVLDANTGVWSPAPSLQDARSGCTAQVIDGKVYVWGGAFYPNSEANKTLVLTAEVFNPETGVWSYTVPPSGAVNNGSSVALPGPGAVSSQGTSFNTAWLFGGETQSSGESTFLQEFIFFYDFVPGSS